MIVLTKISAKEVQATTPSTLFDMTPLSRAQFLCFLLVWLAYASTYLLRKPLGVVKADLGEELGVSAAADLVISQSCIIWFCQVGKVQLGWCDTALVLPYAAIQILWPGIADRF